MIKQFHNMPGSGYYEIALGVSIASLIAQWYLKKKGKEETANLVKGLTLLGLGAICVEAIMTMLKMIGNILL
jgi:hypothetical protein